MAKGMGTAALVAAIVAIIVPLYGLYISAFAIVLSVGAALAGDRIYATATTIIAGVNSFFLSPFMWMLIRNKGNAESNVRSFPFLLLSSSLRHLLQCFSTPGEYLLSNQHVRIDEADPGITLA